MFSLANMLLVVISVFVGYQASDGHLLVLGQSFEMLIIFWFCTWFLYGGKSTFFVTSGNYW